MLFPRLHVKTRFQFAHPDNGAGGERVPGGDEYHGAPAGGRRQEGEVRQHEFVDARVLFALILS